MIKAAQLVGAFEGFLAEGRGYVYGGQGELYTPELAEKWRNSRRSVPSGRNRSTYFTRDCARWFGRRVADCSGGIVDAVRQFEPGFGDRTANTFFAQCKQTGPIATLPDTPGLCVWRKGHIGVYVGGGYAIEFRGTNYGCVKTRVAQRTWTHWGRFGFVDYDTASWEVDRVLKHVSPLLRGEDVRELQRRLLDAGIKTALVDNVAKPLTADGAYGPITASAVRVYQRTARLTVDGKAGRQTVSALGGVWTG